MENMDDLVRRLDLLDISPPSVPLTTGSRSRTASDPGTNVSNLMAVELLTQRRLRRLRQPETSSPPLDVAAMAASSRRTEEVNEAGSNAVPDDTASPPDIATNTSEANASHLIVVETLFSPHENAERAASSRQTTEVDEAGSGAIPDDTTTPPYNLSNTPETKVNPFIADMCSRKSRQRRPGTFSSPNVTMADLSQPTEKVNEAGSGAVPNDTASSSRIASDTRGNLVLRSPLFPMTASSRRTEKVDETGSGAIPVNPATLSYIASDILGNLNRLSPLFPGSQRTEEIDEAGSGAMEDDTASQSHIASDIQGKIARLDTALALQGAVGGNASGKSNTERSPLFPITASSRRTEKVDEAGSSAIPVTTALPSHIPSHILQNFARLDTAVEQLSRRTSCLDESPSAVGGNTSGKSNTGRRTVPLHMNLLLGKLVSDFLPWTPEPPVPSKPSVKRNLDGSPNPSTNPNPFSHANELGLPWIESEEFPAAVHQLQQTAPPSQDSKKHRRHSSTESEVDVLPPTSSQRAAVSKKRRQTESAAEENLQQTTTSSQQAADSKNQRRRHSCTESEDEILLQRAAQPSQRAAADSKRKRRHSLTESEADVQLQRTTSHEPRVQQEPLNKRETRKRSRSAGGGGTESKRKML